MPLAPGQRLGSYEISGVLGAGGMGTVYRARDLALGRQVALKVLGEDAARNPDGVRRLLAEAKAASALNHPNILTVHAVGDEGGAPYVVTELVEGETLRAVLGRGPLDCDRALDIALQALSGLAKAHEIGVVHRDLKPENLMLTGDGLVKILDFGLAKLVGAPAGAPLDTLGVAPTSTGLVMGTASYMSPEQARGQPADARSDLFALGVILYEMLCGENPFRRATIADTVSALLRDVPPPLGERLAVTLAAPAAESALAELAGLVTRLLDKDPAARPGSAREVEAALVAIRDGLREAGVVARPAGAAHRGWVATSGPRSASSHARVGSGAPSVRAMPRVLLYAGAALVLVAALLLAFLPRREAPSGPTPFAPGSQVVAVMAIDNRTTDAELRTADVGRILSDAFVQILYDCKGVQVVSPARLHSLVSAEERSFADTALDDKLARLVCRRSGANTFLSGVLSQIGATYVLHATLTDLGSGRLLGSFEARSHGKEKLLEMLTADLGASVQRTLGGAGGAAIEVGGGLGDVMSYDFEAMMHLSRGTDLNNTGLFQEAVVELQRAVARDPNLALAWSELSCAYSFTGKDTMAARANERAQQLGQRLSRREHRWVEANGVWLAGSGPRYREVLGRFLDDYPDDRQGHFYEGLSWEWLDKDCRQAIASFEKAYRLTPDFFPITKGFVDCYLELGEPERAVAALERYLAVVKSGPGADQARGRLQDLRRAKRA